MENFKNLPIIKKLGFNRIVLVGVLILMYFVFSLGSGRMLGSGDINNALNMVDYLGFLALGVTFVIATDAAYDPVAKISFLRLAANEFLHVVSFIGAHKARFDGLSSGRLLLN